MKKTGPLKTLDRRAQIITMVQERGKVQAQELADLFRVSIVTIRNDLSYLEDKKILHRTRGGAIIQTKVALDLALSEKACHMASEKKRIGKRAAELVQENDAIILDSGTTTMEIARNIKEIPHLTVITHALNIAGELASHENIELIMPGGSLRSTSYSLVGSIAEQSMRNFFCDLFFLGVDGFDTMLGPSTPSVLEAQLNRVMARIANKVIVVADSSKFGKRSLAHLLPLSDIDIVITDTGIGEKDRHNLAHHNIELIIV